jgi:membrane-bound metal-dependent hydrolase YbcI (DUF457 family)
MLLFGHIGVTLGIFFLFAYFAPKLKTIIDPRYLAVGALLPDLIDKPLGMIVFSSSISNGRMISHTILFSLTLFFIGLYLYNKRFDVRVLTLASGSFFHLMEDQMWNTPQTLFWPLLGWNFPKDQIVDAFAFLLMLLKESFIPQFSNGFIPEQTYIPEIIGMIIIVILVLTWIKNRLSKPNVTDNEIIKENAERLATETAALYITGFLIFGLIIVRVIELL